MPPTLLVYLLLHGLNTNELTIRNLTHSHIYKTLETCRSIKSITPLQEAEEEYGKIDIYVRTSDVRRLSDFQMWQVSPLSAPTDELMADEQAGDDTQLHFVKTYWPDFGLNDMLPILLGWQQKVWLRALGL